MMVTKLQKQLKSDFGVSADVHVGIVGVITGIESEVTKTDPPKKIQLL